MSANEFVRKFGWEEAKKKNSEGDNFYVWRRDKEFFKDLKRLVDSHELVECYGGIDAARLCLKSKYREVSTPKTHARLKQAIADVDNCNENQN